MSLFDFILTMKLQRNSRSLDMSRVTCHVKGPFYTWSRYVNTLHRLFLSCEKNPSLTYISNLNVTSLKWSRLITFDDFHDPPPNMSSFQASLSGPPSESFQILGGDWSPPPQGINNVREKYSITRGSGKKNSYANPFNHPYPAQSQMAGPKLHVENPDTVCACDTNLW